MVGTFTEHVCKRNDGGGVNKSGSDRPEETQSQNEDLTICWLI